MEPTEALFDAINRGDIAAARDAISRGAELNGHNILGMTPMELSVDLGRNDISFLLLSMRGTDNGRSGQPTRRRTRTKPALDRPAARPPVTPAKARASPAQPPTAAQTAKAVQRRRRRTDPRCRLSGVRPRPPLTGLGVPMTGISSS